MFANYISHSFCAILAAQNLTAAGGPTAECPAATTSPTPSAAEGGQSGSSWTGEVGEKDATVWPWTPGECFLGGDFFAGKWWNMRIIDYKHPIFRRK